MTYIYDLICLANVLMTFLNKVLIYLFLDIKLDCETENDSSGCPEHKIVENKTDVNVISDSSNDGDGRDGDCVNEPVSSEDRVDKPVSSEDRVNEPVSSDDHIDEPESSDAHVDQPESLGHMLESIPPHSQMEDYKSPDDHTNESKSPADHRYKPNLFTDYINDTFCDNKCNSTY